MVLRDIHDLQQDIFRLKPYGSYTEDRPWEKDVFIGFKKVDMTFVRRT